MTYSDDPLIRALHDRFNPLIRAMMDADAERFPPNAEFEYWCGLPAFTVEEAVALSMGCDPRIISREIIKRLEIIPHPHAVKTAQDAPHLSPLAAAYEDQLRHLERACITGEFENAIKVGDTWQVRPLDLLDWFERQGERYPWNRPHPLFVKHVRECHPAIPNTEKGKAAPFFLGVSKDQRGVSESWNLMRSEMSKPFDIRKFKKMTDLKAYCEDTFDIRHHDFEKLRTNAIKTPGLIRWPVGRPKKTR